MTELLDQSERNNEFNLLPSLLNSDDTAERMLTKKSHLDARSALISSLNARVNAVYDIAAAQSELIYAIEADKSTD